MAWKDLGDGVEIKQLAEGTLVRRQIVEFVPLGTSASGGLPGHTPVPIPDPPPVPTPTPTPTPTPSPVPTPSPAPVPPDAEDSLEYIYTDGLATGWYDYSWANVDMQDGEAYRGQFSVKADLSDWKGLNFSTDNKELGNYTGLSFWVKGDDSGASFHVTVTSGLNPVGGKTVTPISAWTRYTYTWEDLGVPIIGSFSNLVFEGENAGARPPFKFDDIALIKRNGPAPELPAPTPDATPVPAKGGWLEIRNSKFYSAETGTPWVGRGFNFPDFRGCEACSGVDFVTILAESKRRVDEAMSWGADFFRYCVERPITGVLGDPAYYRALKEIIEYMGEKGARVMLSLWHEKSLLGASAGPTSATVPIWQALASTFKHAGYVLYGLSNEPEMNYDGSQSRSVWEAMQTNAAAIRDIERDNGTPAHVIVAQGVGGWSRDVNYYINHPLSVAGPVAYECHPYDHEGDWEELFIRASRAGLPIIAGEYGPAVNPNDGSIYTTMAETEKLIDIFEQRGIPHTAWTFSMRCPPNLLVDHSNGGCGVGMPLEPTAFGKLMQEKLSQYSGA